MPTKYRKAPVEIEAMEWDGSVESGGEIIQWILDEGGMAYDAPHGHLYIETLEGDMKASPGDFIIKGIAGEFYPCKPDIFFRSYEPL